MSIPYQAIAGLPKSTRIECLRRKMLDEPRYVSIEQSRIIVTEACKATEGRPACIRRARALKASLEGVVICNIIRE